MKDRESVFGFIKKHKTAFIGSVDEEGFPNIKAMFAPRKIDGNCLYFSTNTSSLRVRQFMKNPKASIYFYNRGRFKYEGIMLTGTVEVLTDDDIKSAFSLGIEIIMNDTKAHDRKARDNGARIAAWLLWKHGLSIDRLVTHTYWVNNSVGRTFSDVDRQCTNPVAGKKWCPAYIFGSSNSKKALRRWKKFKKLVREYLDADIAKAGE